MKIKSGLWAVCLMFALPGLASAEGLKYTYVQGGFETWTGSDGYSGIYMDGAYRVSDLFYVAGNLTGLSNSGSDLSRFSVRGGYIHPLNDTLHIYAEAGMMRTGFSIKGPCQTFFDGSTFCESAFSDSSTDPMVNAGARMLLNPQVELRAGLQLVTGDYKETFLTGEGAYHLTDEFSAVGALSLMLEAEELQAQFGLRYSF